MGLNLSLVIEILPWLYASYLSINCKMTCSVFLALISNEPYMRLVEANIDWMKFFDIQC